MNRGKRKSAKNWIGKVIFFFVILAFLVSCNSETKEDSDASLIENEVSESELLAESYHESIENIESEIAASETESIRNITNPEKKEPTTGFESENVYENPYAEGMDEVKQNQEEKNDIVILPIVTDGEENIVNDASLEDEPSDIEKGSEQVAENEANTNNETVSDVDISDNSGVGNEKKGKGNGNAENFDLYDNPEQQNTSEQWVLNLNSKKIHIPTCKSVKKIKKENYSTSNLSKEELLSQGYTECGNCFK